MALSPECATQVETVLQNVSVVAFDMDGTLYPRTLEIDTIIQEKIVDLVGSIFFANDTQQAREKFFEYYNVHPSASTSIKNIMSERSHKKLVNSLIFFQKNAQESDKLSIEPDVIPIGTSTEEQTLFIERFARAIVDQGLNTAEITHLVSANPDLVNNIREIRKNRRLGIITSSPPDRTTKILTKLGFDVNPEGDFDFIYTSRQGDKKSGYIYHLALGNLFITPERMLMVGDSFGSDIEGAQKAEILAIKLAAKPKLNESCITISSIEELAKLFGVSVKVN